MVLTKISGGMVVDGTGASGSKTDVLLDGERIIKIETNSNATVDKNIDASGLVVAPGFIDTHSHTDFGILGWPQMSAKLLQGVTTDIVGNCGLGFFPANDLVVSYYKSLVKPLIGVDVEGFTRLRDFMQAVERRGAGLNLAFLLPQGNVRAYVMGVAEGSPTQDQLESMKKIVGEGMQDGAYGLSTGLVYPPGSLSTKSELIELCKVVTQYGGLYTSHVRNEGSGYTQALEEAIEIGRKSGCPVQISHIKISLPFKAMKRARAVIELLNRARAEGIMIHADLYPYTSAETMLAALILRPWVFEGGIEQFRARLRDPQIRARIIHEFLDIMFSMFTLPKPLRFIPRQTIAKIALSIMKKRLSITYVKNQHEVEGLTLSKALKLKYPKRDIFDAAMDFLADEEGSVGLSPRLMKQYTIDYFYQWPHAMVGSDSIVPVSGNAHPRSFGTFPRVLHDIVGRGILSLELAVHKMTGLPAQTFGIKARGLIKEGYYADLVIFDPKTIRDTAVIGNARQYPEGIKYILLNGHLAVQDNQPAKELFGKVLRHETIPKS